MSFLNFLKKLKPKIEKSEEKKEEVKKEEDNCALCNEGNANITWMGQKWHKNCLRKAKKMAKKMI